MIKGYCIINSDNSGYCEFPKRFVSVPNIGDRVRAINTGNELKVVSITHCQESNAPSLYSDYNELEPYIIVELN